MQHVRPAARFGKSSTSVTGAKDATRELCVHTGLPALPLLLLLLPVALASWSSAHHVEVQEHAHDVCSMRAIQVDAFEPVDGLQHREAQLQERAARGCVRQDFDTRLCAKMRRVYTQDPLLFCLNQRAHWAQRAARSAGREEGATARWRADAETLFLMHSVSAESTRRLQVLAHGDALSRALGAQHSPACMLAAHGGTAHVADLSQHANQNDSVQAAVVDDQHLGPRVGAAAAQVQRA